MYSFAKEIVQKFHSFAILPFVANQRIEKTASRYLLNETRKSKLKTKFVVRRISVYSPLQFSLQSRGHCFDNISRRKRSISSPNYNHQLRKRGSYLGEWKNARRYTKERARGERWRKTGSRRKKITVSGTGGEIERTRTMVDRGRTTMKTAAYTRLEIYGFRSEFLNQSVNRIIPNVVQLIRTVAESVHVNSRWSRRCPPLPQPSFFFSPLCVPLATKMDLVPDDKLGVHHDSWNPVTYGRIVPLMLFYEACPKLITALDATIPMIFLTGVDFCRQFTVRAMRSLLCLGRDYECTNTRSRHEFTNPLTVPEKWLLGFFN